MRELKHGDEKMPALRNYRLFISHAWDYNEEYFKIVDFLRAAPNFDWQNYSVPEHDPLPNSQLVMGLYNQIKPVNAVIILSGMYVPHRDWILKEIEIANEFGKPIIGIKPRGNERIPVEVQNSAREIVGWNTDSIVSAIRRWSI